MLPNGMMSALQESGFAPKRMHYLPSISISDERTLLTSGRLLPQSSISPQMPAWVIGEIRVHASQEVAHEEERDFSFRCAWVSIYEKHEGEWAQVVDASFFQFQTTDEESSSEGGRQAVEP
jgi:hypothetical protein